MFDIRVICAPVKRRSSVQGTIRRKYREKQQIEKAEDEEQKKSAEIEFIAVKEK